MQVLVGKKGTEIRLTKPERKLMADCEQFVELLGNHVPSLSEDAVRVVTGLGRLQYAIDPPEEDENDPLAAGQTKVKVSA